jgi:DNA mismatch endonuclease (patch repair protein)
VSKLVPFTARRKHNAKRPASGLDKTVYALLKVLKIPFVKEKKIGRCHVDVFVEPQTIVELAGCYWHKHICLQPAHGWSPEDEAVLARDVARFAFFKSMGYKVVVIWECELRGGPDKVRARLKKLKP